MFRFNKIFVVLCLVISCTSSVHARRRSRIDLPISNAADAPLEDNIAMASEQTEATATASLPPTTIQSDNVESNDITSSSESNSSEELQDCDNIDNISFELVTG